MGNKKFLVNDFVVIDYPQSGHHGKCGKIIGRTPDGFEIVKLETGESRYFKTEHFAPVTEQTMRDEELPGMWSQSDLSGGETDAEPVIYAPPKGAEALRKATVTFKERIENELFIAEKAVKDHKEGITEGMTRAAKIAREGCLVPPDGGSPSQEAVQLCDHIANLIEQAMKAMTK